MQKSENTKDIAKWKLFCYSAAFGGCQLGWAVQIGNIYTLSYFDNDCIILSYFDNDGFKIKV